MAYVKDGILILGPKPMFDDIEDDKGVAVKAKFLEVFGFYPLLDVSEKWEIFDEDMDEPTVLRDYHAIIDTEKLDLLGDFEIGYVVHLLEKVIQERMENPTAAHLHCESSKKYSFSDTEDWWNKITLDEADLLPSNGDKFELIVELG